MSTPPHLSFWGKAHPASPDYAKWHPAAYHSIDVAAVCERLLDLNPALVESFAVAARVDPAAMRAFLILLAVVHDIGKFSAGFQMKVPQYYPEVLGPIREVCSGDHTAIGHLLLSKHLGAALNRLAPNLGPWTWPVLLSAVAGHHGRPVDGRSAATDQIGDQAVAAARSFLAEASAALAPVPFAGRIDSGLAKHLSWRLAGLINLADWIGSNQDIFEYELPGRAVGVYLDEVARPRAREAVERAGLALPQISVASGYAALTRLARAPSPLQAYAETMPLGAGGPVLVLVEDLTGAGKTEAALILAHRLMQQGRADGLFVALPTMATANAMYERLQDIYRRLFRQGTTPSLVLAHGARHLHEGFCSSVLEVGTPEARRGQGDDDVTASAACAAWIADDRRKAFFADVGVGTIDQALLAVLPVKFAPLRLYGLSRRVLIVDEAHAYDAYMGVELEYLIRFHAAQGGSTIILSATLPEERKRNFIDRFRLAVPAGETVSPPFPPDYPLVTAAYADGAVAATKLAPRPDLPRTVTVRRLADAQAGFAEIEQAARDGAAVAYIRNTVDDAIAAYDALTARGVDALLFHARFAMDDRLKIESRVIELFGSRSTPADRRGKVLIATQVVEQSLDLDFDLMVTDLAPIDLVIQRAGRLWRHVRAPRPLGAPQLLVVSPEPKEDADGEWYRRVFRGASFVYENHALLWRTAAVLFTAGTIVSPAGIRPMIEAVYGTGALDRVPPGLERPRLEAEGKSSAEKSTARLNLLDFDEGYTPDSGTWDSEARTPTRLGERRIVLRLARIVGGAILPWAPIDPRPPGSAPADTTRAEARAWALSEVGVAAYRVSARGRYDQSIEAAAVAIETAWRQAGNEAVLLPLIDANGVTTGRAVGGTEDHLRAVEIGYDTVRGVVFLGQRSAGQGG
jgi:CRISPR-associated endonuclease/helicase Cas3